HHCAVEHCCPMSLQHSLRFHRTQPALSRICFLRVLLRNSMTFVSSSPTRAETCPCCLVVCTNTDPRTSLRRHPTESSSNLNAFITTSLVLPFDQLLRHSRASFQPHRFFSGATIRGYLLRTPLKA